MHSFRKDPKIEMSISELIKYEVILKNIDKEPKGPIPEAEMVEPKQPEAPMMLGDVALTEETQRPRWFRRWWT